MLPWWIARPEQVGHFIGPGIDDTRDEAGRNARLLPSRLLNSPPFVCRVVPRCSHGQMPDRTAGELAVPLFAPIQQWPARIWKAKIAPEMELWYNFDNLGRDALIGLSVIF